MIDFSKVFFFIFRILGKSQVSSLLERVSYSLPYIRNFSFIFHHIPNCEHSSLFILHSSLFILHSSFFILHSKKLPHTAFQANFQKFLGFYGELHREFVKHFLSKTIHDEGNSLFSIYSSLVTIEDLVFSYLGGSCLMFYLSSRILCFYIREGMRPTVVAHQ